MVWPALIGAAAHIGGGILGGENTRKLAHEQMDMQREFAQMGIRWKVADARAAGIHPLYALGASGASAAPISVGDSYGPALANAGQDISRAMQAGQDKEERDASAATAFMLAKEQASDARVLRAASEQREQARLSSQLANDEMSRQLMASQIARLNQQANPPFPSGVTRPEPDARGSVDTGRIKLSPSEQPSRDPHSPHKEAARLPMWQPVETAPGVWRDFPSRELNMDSEIVHALLAGQAYLDKWVSDVFFGGAPKYIQHKKRFEPAPGSYSMDRGYQRSGVARKGR